MIYIYTCRRKIWLSSSHTALIENEASHKKQDEKLKAIQQFVEIGEWKRD